MQIEQDRQEETLILKLSGRMGFSEAPQLEKIVKKELENVTGLKLDFKNLEYISSAGLRVLLEASKKMKAKGGTMTLYHVNEQVMEVLEITGFRQRLDIR